jgi:hypothetical protein
LKIIEVSGTFCSTNRLDLLVSLDKRIPFYYPDGKYAVFLGIALIGTDPYYIFPTSSPYYIFL